MGTRIYAYIYVFFMVLCLSAQKKDIAEPFVVRLIELNVDLIAGQVLRAHFAVLHQPLSVLFQVSGVPRCPETTDRRHRGEFQGQVLLWREVWPLTQQHKWNQEGPLEEAEALVFLVRQTTIDDTIWEILLAVIIAVKYS